MQIKEYVERLNALIDEYEQKKKTANKQELLCLIKKMEMFGIVISSYIARLKYSTERYGFNSLRSISEDFLKKHEQFFNNSPEIRATKR